MELVAVQTEAELMVGERAVWTNDAFQVHQRPIGSIESRIETGRRIAAERHGARIRRSLIGLQIGEIGDRGLIVEDAARVRLHVERVDHHLFLDPVITKPEILERRGA